MTDNRLVARQLERDWETALVERQRLGDEYDRFTADHIEAVSAAAAILRGIAMTLARAALVVATWHGPGHDQPAPRNSAPTDRFSGPAAKISRGNLTLGTATDEPPRTWKANG